MMKTSWSSGCSSSVSRKIPSAKLGPVSRKLENASADDAPKLAAGRSPPAITGRGSRGNPISIMFHLCARCTLVINRHFRNAAARKGHVECAVKSFCAACGIILGGRRSPRNYIILLLFSLLANF